MTNLRTQVIASMYGYGKILECLNKGWKVLEVGVAGDPKPGGNYKFFGVGNDYKTLDISAEFDPDIVADICDTGLEGASYDLVILSQTLEHIYDFRKAVKECSRILKKGGWLIIDCPFYYPYHAEPEFADYWRLSPSAMTKVLLEVNFQIESCQLLAECLTTALARKEYATN
jgi:SAM-dependent methyltransferase